MVLQGESQTRMYQMLAQRAALRTEIRTGRRFSSKGSIAAQIRRQHHLTSLKKTDLVEEFTALIVKLGGPA